VKADSFAAQATGRSGAALLNVDFCPGVFELFLDCGGFFFVDALFHCLGSAINQILGFFQAQAGDFTNRLNHVDLVSAHFGENDGFLLESTPLCWPFCSILPCEMKTLFLCVLV
jgi:hypothetical protein